MKKKLTNTAQSSRAAREGRVRDVDADFDPEVLKTAQQIVAGYRFVIRPSEALGYVGHTLEMPLVLADGRTHEECLKATMFAVETAVATMLEADQKPPEAAVRRSEQINIRLTSEEKLILEEESQRKGYKGLSDYVRAAALAQASK